ncbi:hypothetical protein N7493_002877 [Penicillium malachiteum]|uniref:3beta-hydroxysteroid 3-dehydrogenase n=1 Tax=Penicillium malachiteum TaxID=1324776 RepID=A0AAD6HT77_9EURO|nr:hypothetical protein N7493_002877 [Penicillium malachiteum]
MTGTVIITGASGSLAIATVKRLLSDYPSLTVLGTVRDVSKLPKSASLLRLEEITSQYPPGKFITRNLDMGSLSEVQSFAKEVAKQVESGELPSIRAIVCNAFTRSLDGQKFTQDYYESTFQVNHLAHFVLVLGLLRSMNRDNGRIVMLSSEVHDPQNHNPLSALGAQLPVNGRLDELVKPRADDPGKEHDMGWRRYANSKLANVMFMESLNKRLQKSPELEQITLTAMNPGGIVDSRAHIAQRVSIRILFRVFALLLPIFRLFTSQVRSSMDSAIDLVALVADPAFHSVRGHFNGSKPQPPATVAKNEQQCEAIWSACWEWGNMIESDTCVVK